MRHRTSRLDQRAAFTGAILALLLAGSAADADFVTETHNLTSGNPLPFNGFNPALGILNSVTFTFSQTGDVMFSLTLQGVNPGPGTGTFSGTLNFHTSVDNLPILYTTTFGGNYDIVPPPSEFIEDVNYSINQTMPNPGAPLSLFSTPFSFSIGSTDGSVTATATTGPAVAAGPLIIETPFPREVSVTATYFFTTTPEPASLTLFSLGLAGLAGYGWRRRKS